MKRKSLKALNSSSAKKAGKIISKLNISEYANNVNAQVKCYTKHINKKINTISRTCTPYESLI